MSIMVMAVPIIEANNYGCGLLWVYFLMSMPSAQRGLITEQAAAILLWTGRLMAGLALATSQFATTDLPEHTRQPGPVFFSKTFVWEEKYHSEYFPTLLVLKEAFSSLQRG